MKFLTFFIKNLLILILFLSIFPQNAYGYIDPGTGSYILQLVMAVLFGTLFAVKLFWNNLKAFFENMFSAKKKI